MPFIESDLENLIIDQIKNKNYEYVYGENLDRNYEDIINIQKWNEKRCFFL